MTTQPYTIHDDDKIYGFTGDYRFLSNFSPALVFYHGRPYPAVENAYQAAKAGNPEERRPFERCSPAEAKKMGRKVKLRGGWEENKFRIMTGLLVQKFLDDPVLGPKLLDTGRRLLIEANHWGDTEWGVDTTRGGKNLLGVALMNVRELLFFTTKQTNP